MEVEPERAPLVADPEMSVVTSVSSDGRAATLTIDGELDDISAPALRDAVDFILAGAAPSVVELDLAGMTFLGSAGIHCLLTCRERAAEAGSRLVLVDPSAQVVRVLEIAGLLTVFELPGTPAKRPGVRIGPHHDQTMSEVVARSAHLRHVARETQARARGARGESTRGE